MEQEILNSIRAEGIFNLFASILYIALYLMFIKRFYYGIEEHFAAAVAIVILGLPLIAAIVVLFSFSSYQKAFNPMGYLAVMEYKNEYLQN